MRLNTIIKRVVVLAAIVAVQLAMAASAVAESTLADAAESGDAEAIRIQFETKADVNAKQADGMTALHWAALHNNADLARRFIVAGASPNATNRYGVTPLQLACRNGNTAIVDMLLDAGADVNLAGPSDVTPLMIAARTGRRGPVDALLARGADIDARERKHQTALMWAAADGHEEVVDALLNTGADFRTSLTSGFTPLFFAVREGRRNVVQQLIKVGADVNDTMKPTGDKQARDKKPTTALILAVECGHFELAAELLRAGADPNTKPAGYSALHAITWVRKPIRGDGNPSPIGSGKLSSLAFVRQLVAAGADVNVRLEKGAKARGRFTTTGSTPFLLAARASDVPLMRLLVELGAAIKLSNADNCTPLLAATGVGALEDGEEAAGTEEEALEAVRMLLDRSADVNAVDDNGETAVHGAAYQNRSKVIELLAERKADINVWNVKNKAGWTPLMIAHGHRPGNFRPEPESIAVIEQAMRAAGVDPPTAVGKP